MTFIPSFCPNCGETRLAGASFCAKCGHDMAATSSGYGSSVPPPALYPVIQNQKGMPVWKRVLLVALSLVIVFSLLIFAGSAYSLYSRGNNPVAINSHGALNSQAAFNTPAPSTDLTASNINYAVYFAQDYSAMITADNTALAQANSATNAKDRAAGINARVTVHRNFDTQVLTIDWPPSKAVQQTGVINADIALEQYLATMAANTANITYYNSLAPGLIPIQTAFDTASLDVMIKGASGSASSPTGGGAGSGNGGNGGASAGFPANLPAGNYDISECIQVPSGWGNCKSGGVFRDASLEQTLTGPGYLLCQAPTTCTEAYSTFDGTSFTVTQTQVTCDPGSPCGKAEVLFKITKQAN
jgi:hypothetical protein